jgi:hypothetical protein
MSIQSTKPWRFLTTRTPSAIKRGTGVERAIFVETIQLPNITLKRKYQKHMASLNSGWLPIIIGSLMFLVLIYSILNEIVLVKSMKSKIIVDFVPIVFL